MFSAASARKAFVASTAFGLVNLLAVDLYFGPRVFAASPLALVQEPATTPDASVVEPLGIPSVVRSLEPRVVARFESEHSASIVDTELKKLAAEMIADPSVDVILEGHSDPLGNETFNKSLSLERASWARDRLVTFGVSPSRIETRGLGSARTLEPTVDSVAVNRRVEARLVPSGTVRPDAPRTARAPARVEDAAAPTRVVEDAAVPTRVVEDAGAPTRVEPPPAVADAGDDPWIP